MAIDNLLIKVFEEIGGDAAVSSEDGDRIFSKLNKALQTQTPITLDFKNITLITSAFLNAAIGQLYHTYTSDQLNAHLKLENLSPEDLATMRKVVARAKEYFEDRESAERIIDNNL
jgi:hypothetical protein